MIGMEFDVDLSNSLPPQLWIIRKQYRESPTKVTLQKMYYILNSTVYQAPDLDTLLESRLLTSLYQISNVFDRTLDRAVFDPVDSRFRWKDDALRDAASLEQSALSGSEAHGMADMRRGLDRIIGRKLAS